MGLVGGTIWSLIAFPVPFPFPLGICPLLCLHFCVSSSAIIKVRGQGPHAHTALCPSDPSFSAPTCSY